MWNRSVWGHSTYVPVRAENDAPTGSIGAVTDCGTRYIDAALFMKWLNQLVKITTKNTYIYFFWTDTKVTALSKQSASPGNMRL